MQDIDQLKDKLRQFAEDRDWDQFHSPKNLAMALSVETSELLEHFQWLTEKQSAELPEDKLNSVAEEAADILLYLIRLTDKLNINLLEEADKKIAKNAQKYPVDKVKGSSKKYTEY